MIKLTLHRLGVAGSSYVNPFLQDAFTCFFVMCVWLCWRAFSVSPVHPQAQVCYSSNCEGISLGITVLVIINTHLYFTFIFCSYFLSINKLEKNASFCSLVLSSFSSINIKVFHLLEVRKTTDTVCPRKAVLWIRWNILRWVWSVHTASSPLGEEIKIQAFESLC